MTKLSRMIDRLASVSHYTGDRAELDAACGRVIATAREAARTGFATLCDMAGVIDEQSRRRIEKLIADDALLLDSTLESYMEYATHEQQRGSTCACPICANGRMLMQSVEDNLPDFVRGARACIALDKAEADMFPTIASAIVAEMTAALERNPDAAPDALGEVVAVKLPEGGRIAVVKIGSGAEPTVHETGAPPTGPKPSAN